LRLTDHIGVSHHIGSTPVRIVCLVPSISELLCDMGLSKYIVGCTKFCIFPQSLKKTSTRIGGTKNINLQKVKDLSPDIIIANKEENLKSDVEALRHVCPVWVSDISTLDDTYAMILSLGHIFSVQVKAEEIIDTLKQQLEKQKTELRSVVYLIWQEPYMTIGGDTFISHMLLQAGYRNVYEDTMRYPVINIEDIKSRHPDAIFLSSEPFPFKEAHVKALHKSLPHTPKVLVDGAYFSWYGSRQLHSADYQMILAEKIQSQQYSNASEVR
jgi:ABC-type Fe3+-hydroxamate transport system substrate-binding protein